MRTSKTDRASATNPTSTVQNPAVRSTPSAIVSTARVSNPICWPEYIRSAPSVMRAAPAAIRMNSNPRAGRPPTKFEMNCRTNNPKTMLLMRQVATTAHFRRKIRPFRVSEFDDPAFQAYRGGMCSIIRIQLRQDILDPAFDRVFGNRKDTGDFSVRISSGNQTEDIDLRWCQCIICRVFGKLKRSLGRQSLFTAVDCADHAYKVFVHGAF